MNQSKRIKLSDINQSLVCILCGGYFIDATTITQCLHSFCKSCIVRYLESNKYCPICDVQVHETKPLQNIRADQTLQNIVYKLVPGLFRKEYQSRAQFYSQRPDLKPVLLEQNDDNYIYMPEDKFSLSIEYKDVKNNSFHKRRYLECPGAVTISHLHKLVKAKYNLNSSNNIEMYYDTDYLDPTLTLIDIAYIYSWRRKCPIDLSYTILENIPNKIFITPEGINNEEKIKPPCSIEEKINSEKDNAKWTEVQIQISESGIMSFTNIDSHENNNNAPCFLEKNDSKSNKFLTESNIKEIEKPSSINSEFPTPTNFAKFQQKIDSSPLRTPKMAVVAPNQTNKRQSYKTLKSPPKNWNPSVSRISPQSYSSPSKPNKFFKGRNQSRQDINLPSTSLSNTPTTPSTTSTTVRHLNQNKPSMLRIDPKTLTPIPSTITSTNPPNKGNQITTPVSSSNTSTSTSTIEKTTSSINTQVKEKTSVNDTLQSQTDINSKKNFKSKSTTSGEKDISEYSLKRSVSTNEQSDNNNIKNNNSFSKSLISNAKKNSPKHEYKANNNIEKIAQSLSQKQNQEKITINSPATSKIKSNVNLSGPTNHKTQSELDSIMFKQTLKNINQSFPTQKIPGKHGSISNNYLNSLPPTSSSSSAHTLNDVHSYTLSKHPAELNFVKSMPLVPMSQHKPMVSLPGTNETSLIPHVGIHRMPNPVVPSSSFITNNKINTNGLSRLLSPFLHGGYIYPAIPQFNPRIPNSFPTMSPSIDLLLRYQGLEGCSLEDPGVDLSRKIDKDKANRTSK